MTLPRLWAAAVLVCVFAGVSLTWVYGADYWWHVRYGELLLATGELPRTDPFTFTQGGQAYTYGFWFSAGVLAVVQGVAALPLLQRLRVVQVVQDWQLFGMSQARPLFPEAPHHPTLPTVSPTSCRPLTVQAH